MKKPLIECLGLCYIGHHVKKTGYILLRLVNNALIEPFISISGEEMETHGLPVVIDHLRKTPDSGSYKEVSMFDEGTKKLMYKLKRNHLLVSISLLRSLEQDLSDDHEEIEMIPLHSEHGWQFSRRAEEIRKFRLPMTNQAFMNDLSEALEMAS
jgi:hypothetical protein